MFRHICKERIFSENSESNLVNAIGKPHFAQTILDFSRKFTPVDSAIIFNFDSCNTATRISSATKISTTKLDRAVNQFENHFHQQDPNSKLMKSSLNAGHYLTRSIASDIEDSSFRWACWQQTDVVERYSFLKGDANGWWQLDLFREKSSGFFSDKDLFRLDEAWALMIAATEKHVFIEKLNMPNEFSRRMEVALDTLASLSQREKEVCRQILQGKTAQEIAINLAIGETSVITFRKRAYTKLNINSRLQLMELCVSIAQRPKD